MKVGDILGKILVIFDIDDTLVHTQTEVNVIKDGQVIKSLNSHEFTHYKLGDGESFDFENFRNAREFFDNHRPIIPMMNQLRRDIARGNKVVMVTARADFDDKELFLDTFRKYKIDIDKVHVYRAGNLKDGSTEERKKKIIKMLLDKGEYTKAIMYDDAKPNLDLFISLKREHPQTMFYAWHVDLEGNASEYMRESVEEKWSAKYKRSINCNNPKGFSQKAHCAGRKKNEDIDTTLDLNKALDTLEPRLKDVVLMRFKYDMSFARIGKELGVGAERARQIFLRAMRKLRHPSRGITERKTADLYHNTMYPVEILKSGKIKTNLDRLNDLEIHSDAKPFISLTRDPRFDFHGMGDAQFVIDQGKLANTHKIVPFDYGGYDDDGAYGRRQESEERVFKDIPLSYVKKIVVQSEYHVAAEEYIPLAKELGIPVVDKKGNRLEENFADGKRDSKSSPGRVKRAGASCNGSVTDLRKRAKNASGEKAKMYHWCANMKSGKKK